MAKAVALCDILRFMAAQDSYWENACGINKFLRGIAAEISHDLAASSLLPLLGILVSILPYFVEPLDCLHFWSSLPD
jgi:hypothetical protein